MSKKVTSVSVDKPLKEEMEKREDVNWSAVVNEFLKEFVGSGESLEATLAVRRKQLEDELAEIRSEEERKERELERIRERLEERRESRQQVFDSFASLSLQQTRLDPSNDAVKNHAEKLDMTPQEFLMKFDRWADGD